MGANISLCSDCIPTVTFRTGTSLDSTVFLVTKKIIETCHLFSLFALGGLKQ
jgi:hypothetical protein